MSVALVTGATGFVGSHLLRELLTSGWTCRVLVRDPEKARGQLPPSVELVKGDISDPKSLRGIGQGVDSVFHTAAQLNLPGVLAADYKRVNLQGTQNLVEALRGASLSRFVHVSSIAAVGLRSYGMIDETFHCDPDLPYGISKLRIDEYLRNAFEESGFPCVIVRPPTVYGEGERYNFLSLCRAIESGRFLVIGSGHNRIDFCWAGNLVQAMVRAADHGRSGELYLVADEPTLTFREGCDILSRLLRGRPLGPPALPTAIAYAAAYPLAVLGKLTGRPVPLYPSRVRTMTADLCFDLTKAKQELGYSASGPFQELAARTIDWYRAAGLLAQRTD
jgi:nucleoside-diphosphate-sugar epimerase